MHYLYIIIVTKSNLCFFKSNSHNIVPKWKLIVYRRNIYVNKIKNLQSGRNFVCFQNPVVDILQTNYQEVVLKISGIGYLIFFYIFSLGLNNTNIVT